MGSENERRSSEETPDTSNTPAPSASSEDKLAPMKHRGDTEEQKGQKLLARDPQAKASFRFSQLEEDATGGWVRPAWRTLRSSFWFLPTLGTVGGLALSLFTRYVDRNWNGVWGELPVVFSGGATNAYYVLSAVTGSLITVIATSFSLTLVILQLASGQYSPRLLKSFTADSSVQLAIGTYMATFVYALMILMFMYTPKGDDVEVFIPLVSLTVTIALTMVCVAVLIYFIQHISKLVQSSTIVRMAQNDTLEAISKLEDLDHASEEAPNPTEDPALEGLLSSESLVIRSKESGYLQRLDIDSIARLVAVGGETVVMEIPFAPGHFVSAGLPLVKVWSTRKVHLGTGDQNKIHRAFKFGPERSFQQDFPFGLRQLSDIALKALSPGVNDPTTAMQAIDRMEAIFIALGSKALPSRLRERDVNGAKVLVKAKHPSFDDNVGLAFDQVRRAAFAGGDVAVLERLIEAIEHALLANTDPDRRQALWERIFTVALMAPRRIPDPNDAANLIRRVVETGAQLDIDQHPRLIPDFRKLIGIFEKLEDASKAEDLPQNRETQTRTGRE